MAIIARISDSDIDRKRSSSPPTRSSLFTLKRQTNGPSRCLKSAQAARIVAQREELSRLGPFEPDNPNTFVSSPLVGDQATRPGCPHYTSMFFSKKGSAQAADIEATSATLTLSRRAVSARNFSFLEFFPYCPLSQRPSRWPQLGGRYYAEAPRNGPNWDCVLA